MNTLTRRCSVQSESITGVQCGGRVSKQTKDLRRVTVTYIFNPSIEYPIRDRINFILNI